MNDRPFVTTGDAVPAGDKPVELNKVPLVPPTPATKPTDIFEERNNKENTDA